jgi:hypothetical protein
MGVASCFASCFLAAGLVRGVLYTLGLLALGPKTSSNCHTREQRRVVRRWERVAVVDGGGW